MKQPLQSDNPRETFLSWWKERNSRPGFYGSATVDGITVVVKEGVYSPDPSCTHASAMLTRVLCDLSNKTVLDIGTGTGILAIYAAKKGAKKVTAVDIQPEAIDNAIENVMAFGFGDVIEIFSSDVFDSVGGIYDVIIANLPIMDPQWTELNAIATEVNRRFFSGVEAHLKSGGKAYISSTSWGDIESLRTMIRKSKLSCITHAEEARDAEWYVFELTRE